MTVELDTAGPGIEYYRSSLFTAEVNGTAVYVYGWEAAVFWTAPPLWEPDDLVEASWVKFGADEPVTVTIALADLTPITTATVYPKNLGVEQSIAGGELTLVVPATVRRGLRVEINGDRANVFQVFAQPVSDPPADEDKVDWSEELALVVASVNTGTDEIDFGAAHGLAGGETVVLSIKPDAEPGSISLPGGLEFYTPYTVTVTGANTITLLDAGGDLVDITSSGGIFRVNVQAHSDVTKALYFGPGRHTIGRDFVVANGTSVYLDYGAVVVGGFKLRDITGVTFYGAGHLSGEDAVWDDVRLLPYTQQISHTWFNGGLDADNYQNSTVTGLTMFFGPFWADVNGVYSYRNCQIISFWTPNTDGYSPARQNATNYLGEVVDCYSFTGDDNQRMAPGKVTKNATGCFAINAVSANFMFGYEHIYSPIGQEQYFNITDCDAMHLGVSSQEYGSVVKAWVDGTTGYEQYGIFNVTIDGFRIWGPLGRRIFDIRNYSPSWDQNVESQFGQIQDWTVTDLSCEETPDLTSIIHGLNATNTPHDLTFTNLTIGGTRVTSANYADFFDINSFPYNLTFDAVVVEPEVLTDAQALWDAVEAAYPSQDLVSLTNIRDRDATATVTATGESAAQEVLDLWPIYAQVDYDATNRTHVAVARRGVIAVLWARGGTSQASAKVEWEEVFGDSGTISRVRRTGPRGRRGPASNSEFEHPIGMTAGRTIRPWSHPSSLPFGIMPSVRTSRE